MPDLSNPGEFFAQFGVESNPLFQIQQSMGALAGFGDPRFRALMGQLDKQFASAIQGQTRVGAMRGARLGQDISSAVGAIGGGATGAGAVTRSLASSAATGAAAEATAQGKMAQAGMTAQLGAGYLQNLMGMGSQLGAGLWQTAMGGWNQQAGMLNQLKGQREALGFNPMNLLGAGAAAINPLAGLIFGQGQQKKGG